MASEGNDSNEHHRRRQFLLESAEVRGWRGHVTEKCVPHRSTLRHIPGEQDLAGKVSLLSRVDCLHLFKTHRRPQRATTIWA